MLSGCGPRWNGRPTAPRETQYRALFPPGQRFLQSCGTHSGRANAPASGFLPQADIEQCQPILKGLQAKTAKDEPNIEGSEPAFRKAVSVVLNEGIHGNSGPGDQAVTSPTRIANGQAWCDDEDSTAC